MSTEQVIARHRLARAHRLVAEIDRLGGPEATDAQRLELARSLTLEQWDQMVGLLADHHADQLEDPNLQFVPFAQREPSDVTVAMAIVLLEERVTKADDDPFRGFPTY